MPESLVPMLARAGGLPRDERGWAFEVKWDGVRAVAYPKPGRLRLESRNLSEITASYPEVRGSLLSSGCARRCSTARSSRSTTTAARASAGSSGGCTSPRRRGQAAPALDAGHVRDLRPAVPRRALAARAALQQRRERLDSLELNGPAWRARPLRRAPGKSSCSDARAGARGRGRQAARQPYEPGRRSGTWMKVKNAPARSS